MVIPRAESSSSSIVTAADCSLSPGTITAHSRFSRKARLTMRQRSRPGGVVAPIRIIDQWLTSASAVSRSGNSPCTIK
jgi:hypothetical protein